MVSHDVGSLHTEVESLRRLMDWHRQTVMVAIISSQLTAFSIVYLVAQAMQH